MLWGKEGDSERKKYEFSILSNLVNIEPKHANKFLLQGIKTTTKHN